MSFIYICFISSLPVAPPRLTHALTLVVLVNEDVVQHEGQQLVLQRVVGVEDQRLETLPAAGRQLVAEDHQQVAQEHERLRKKMRVQRPRRAPFQEVWKFRRGGTSVPAL